MPTLAIGMTVAPRPGGGAYYPEALRSLRAAGYSQPVHLFTEPGTPAADVGADILLHPNSVKRGCYKNWRHALTQLLVLEPAAEWLLMLQDDGVWRGDAHAKLQDGMARYPHVGFLSPYTSKAMLSVTSVRNIKVNRTDAWVPVKFHNKAFWGAVATCWPRAAVERLLACPRVVNHDHHRKVDVVIGNACRDLGLPILVHAPSLANHIGKKSTIGRDKLIGNQWGRVGCGFRSEP